MMSTVGEGMVIKGVILFVIANVGFESALVFYNAYLPDIAPRTNGAGYRGSGLALGIWGRLSV